MTKNKTSFWNLIEHSIEIPIIQRDYAQGRVGKEYLRRDFLANIKRALDSDEILTLDFIYGTVEPERNRLQPLDGQQRLTTLWLLHWYIALRSGVLKETNVHKKLQNFTYETRISSREFCENLCQPENFESYQDGDKIISFIKSRTWFYSAWKQDPTIQAMMNMLEGNPKGNMIDGIEKLFPRTTTQDEFKTYWNKLISKHTPIVFYYLPLKDFGLSDDLYIKMNARGKQLTAFENFKADLIGYIQAQATKKHDKAWEKLLNATEGIPYKLDTTWTDIFWENTDPDCMNRSINEIYYAFLNRFFWNELFIAKDQGNKNYQLAIGEGKRADGSNTSTIENENLSYNYLNKEECDMYEGLAPYKFANGEIPLSLFTNLQTVLERYASYVHNKHEIPKVNWEKDFEFIPKYKGKEITALNQIQRIAFFAICKYFKEGDGDEASLKRWMRVVWNLISGIDEKGAQQIRSTSTVRKAIEYIDRLDSHQIYNCLCQQSQEMENPDWLQQRWNEEITKAQQIWDKANNCLRKYNNSTDEKTWENIIIDAENYAFFKGTIRFLIRDKEGNDDWTSFDTKWKNVKAFFNESIKNSDYGDTELLKTLISNFSTEHFEVLWNHCTFNNKPESWMYYLLNDKICAPIHSLLVEGKNCRQHLEPSDNPESNILYLLSNTNLLDFVKTEIPNARIRKTDDEHYAIYPEYQTNKVVFLHDRKRDHFLIENSNEKTITIDEKHKLKDTELFYGPYINFKYEGKNCQWYRNDSIYLMDDEDPNTYKLKNEKETEETKRWYCFKVTKESNNKEILEAIHRIIKEAESAS